MEITGRQRQQLRTTKAYQADPPTVGGFFRTSWRIYALLVVLCGAGVVISRLLDWRSATGLFVGLLLAAVLRDLGWYSRIVQSWPLTREITKWERVDELLRDEGIDGT